MTNDEIKAARALCANVKESECEQCVCRDCLAEYHALDEIRDILPAALDALEAARRERDEARAEIERLVTERDEAVRRAGEWCDAATVAELRVKRDQHATDQLGGHRMDADGGPVCQCGKQSTHESGWCGACGVNSSLSSDPLASVYARIDALGAEIAELRGLIANACEIISEAGRLIVARWKP